MANSRPLSTIIKKNLYLILSIVFLSLSLVETIYLASRPQDTRNRAEGCDPKLQCHCSCGKSFCANPLGTGCNTECADACGMDYKDYMKQSYPQQSVPRVPADLKCPAQYYPCNVGCCGYAGNAGKRIGYDENGKEVTWDSNTKWSDLPQEIRDAINNGLSKAGLKRRDDGTIENDLKPNAETQKALDKNPELKKKYESGVCYLIVGGSLFCPAGGYVGDPCMPSLVGGGDMCTKIGVEGNTESVPCSEIGMIRCYCSNGIAVIGSTGQTCDNLCGGSNNICTSCTNEGEKVVNPTKTPSPTRTPTPTATTAPTRTPTPTSTTKPTQTPTGTLKPTNTPTSTLKPTNTPTGTLAPTQTPTATEKPTATVQPTATDKPLAYDSPEPTVPQEEIAEGPSPTRIVLPQAGFEFPSQALTIVGAIVTLLGILVLL